MPVKKVPGGYRIVPSRPGPVGARPPKMWLSREEEAQTVDGGQDAYQTAMAEGGPGGDAQAMPPVNGGTPDVDAGGAPPSLSLPGPGMDVKAITPGAVKPGSVGADVTAQTDKDKESDDAQVEAVKSTTLDKGKAEPAKTGKAGKATGRARAIARRPPPRPPRRP